MIHMIDDTPLVAAPHHHRAECVAERMRLGADAFWVNHCGSTALQRCVAATLEKGRSLRGCWLRRGVTLWRVTTGLHNYTVAVEFPLRELK